MSNEESYGIATPLYPDPPELQGATFVSLPPGRKSMPVKGVHGNGISERLDAPARAALLAKGATSGGNVALLCGGERVAMPDGTWSSVCVLDVDVKPERTVDGKKIEAQKGPETLASLEAEFGALPVTRTATTASGGSHLYFWCPPDLDVSNKVGTGLEFQNEGFYVLYPGSELREGSCDAKDIPGRYTWANDAPIAELPARWVEGLRARSKAKTAGEAHDVSVPLYEFHAEGRIAKARSYLQKTAKLSIDGQNGSDVFMGVAVTLTRLMRLPIEDATRLIETHYQPRLVAAGTTTWSEKEVRHKLVSAAQSGTVPLDQEVALDVLERGLRHCNDYPAGSAANDTASDDFSCELLDVDLPLPELSYLVDGILGTELVTMFVAHGGSLKTWAALSIALAVQSGQKWLGWIPVTQGNVLLIDYESGKYETQRRVHLLHKNTPRPRIHYTSQPGDLHKPKTWTKIEQTINARDIKLVIIDSLAGGSGDVDENSSLFSKPLKDAAKVTERTGCSFLFIHHTPKNADGWKAVRGHSSLHAACDAIFAFTDPVISGGEASTTLKVLKGGPGKAPKPVKLVLSDAHGLQHSIKDAEAQDQREGKILAFLKMGPKPQRAIEAHVGGRAVAVREIVKEMAAKGIILLIRGLYQIDTVEQRAERIIAHLKKVAKDSGSEIRRIANVADSDIERLLGMRQILKSGSHYSLLQCA